MEVNFFGLIHVTRKALKIMREVNKPCGGKIQQITSIGGQRGVPTFSIYCASKWAVEGFTEALSHELKPEWNIKLTCIEPGGFRTDWAGRSMIFGEQKEAAYDHIDAESQMKKRNGTQAGDPAKGGRAFWEVAKMEDPPLRLVVGSDAYKAIMEKIKTYGELYPKYEKLSSKLSPSRMLEESTLTLTQTPPMLTNRCSPQITMYTNDHPRYILSEERVLLLCSSRSPVR